MSKKMKWIIGIVVLIVIAVMVVFNLRKTQGKTIDVTTTQVKQGELTRTVSG